ncbi:MAG TPA: FAD-dependent oxidoreductase, partial [Candidatus Baltobacteraceae bacterium]|nr:FAD-dependent oxidoreductase [Candidatus Baltobacteraceae bacterium]
PAGIMLGYLLARSGIDVTVLEKHKDFFRDFRGDTIHPSTLQVMDELGLLDELLQIPHSEVRDIRLQTSGQMFHMAQMDRVPGRCKFVAVMPQWDFLNFLAQKAKAFPSFHLLMQSEATDLIRTGGRVTGVWVRTPDGPTEIRADLVVACDGRHSTLRDRAGLPLIDLGAPIDVLWMRVGKRSNEPDQTFGNVAPGGILVAIDRRDYYQCAFVIRKGGFEELHARGIEAFRATVRAIAPFLGDAVDDIRSWDDVKLLTVTVNRLRTWYLPGLLCIGDAAHAMSPVGGVGINLAIQDAVATANLLIPPLRNGTVSEKDLRAVQRRREWPAKATQWLQVQIQNRLFSRVLSASERITLPKFFTLFDRWPFLRRIPAYIIGVGFRPEHVHQKPSTSA